MKICFTLDDVLRKKTYQMCQVYKKKVNADINLESLKLDEKDMMKELNFTDKNEYNKFLYEDYPYEIFGEAPIAYKLLAPDFNMWLLGLTNLDIEEPVGVMIANPFEFNLSIGWTCFFLSKLASRVREYYFPTDSITIWDRCDMLITAEPRLIKEKPDGKICVKIEMPYNKDLEADYTYASVKDFLNDKEKFYELIEEKEGI
jgi:hypothetical protein